MSGNALIIDLKAEIASGRVVVIAGTGVSITACQDREVDGHRVARWDGLLFHGIDQCEKTHGLLEEQEAEVLRMQVKLGTPDFLVTAAELVSTRLCNKSPGVFHRWLKDTVGKLEPVQPEILNVLASLPGVLATLTYDGLFERTTPRDPITWQDQDKVESVLRGKITDALLHLHGYYEQPDSVVLGLGSYAKVAEDLPTKAVLRLFTLDRTLLFVGCGGTLKDPNFSRLVEWGSESLKDSTHRHFLLCRDEEVNTLRTELKSTPWLHPVGYGKAFNELVPFLRDLVPPPGTVPRPTPNRAPVALGLDLDGYRQAMRKFYGRIKLEDLDPTSHEIRPLALTSMFIPQDARECAEFLPRAFELPKELEQRLRESREWDVSALDQEMFEVYGRAYRDESPRPILEVVGDLACDRLVILGAPGSGKSTLLQYLLLQWAEQTPPHPSGQALSILIDLREYARLSQAAKVSGFLDFIDAGESVRHHLDRNRLDALLKSDPSLLLFDGLDEVFDPHERRQVSTAIHRFADQYPRARIIVTSRVIGYRHEAWRDEGFRHFMLQDLDEAQVRDFLSRWHRNTYADRTDGETKQARLARAIQDSSAIRQFAGNPLLLTMMALLNRTQDLPRDRAELYEQCARLLLHQWKIDLGSDPELAKATLDYKDKRNLLLGVARVMHESDGGLKGNLIEEVLLESTLAQGLEDVPGLRAERAARALIGQLRGRNFMLCWLGGGSYAFVHRTFLEYFCALEIRLRFEQEQTLSLEQLKSEVYGRHWRDENWREVLCLLAGMIAPRFVAEILVHLLERPDPEHRCANVFLAARCVREVRKHTELGSSARHVGDRIRGLVEFYSPYKRIARDIRTRAVASYAEMSPYHPDTLRWLKCLAEPNGDLNVRQAAVKAVARGWPEDRETFPWLKSVAQSSGDFSVCRVAVEAIAHGWPDRPETLSWLKSRVHSDENFGVRLAAVQALAHGWPDEPDTLSSLKSSAQFDKNPDVRVAAAVALARGWPKDPETQSILKYQAQSDKNPLVRLGAVCKLAGGWPKDDELFEIFRSRSQDTNSSVRRSAILALAQRCRDYPDTLDIVKSAALSDQDRGVRRIALVALAQAWRNNPDTLDTIRSHAESDKNPDVRQVALETLARGWPRDAETLPWLKSRAASDKDPEVRGTAVKTIALGWPDHLETLPWLKSCAESDKHPDVRRAALKALAQGWRDDPATLPWLRSLAESAEHGDVRGPAVRALARGWPDHQDTLPFLKSRAQVDVHWSVRHIALEGVVLGWSDEPETLPWLKSRAQSDEHEDVRRAAVEAVALGWPNDPGTSPWLVSRVQREAHWHVRLALEEALARLSRHHNAGSTDA